MAVIRKRTLRRKPNGRRELAPLDVDGTGAIWNLVDSARILSCELPGKHELTVSMLLGEVRRIIRRGRPEVGAASEATPIAKPA